MLKIKIPHYTLCATDFDGLRLLRTSMMNYNQFLEYFFNFINIDKNEYIKDINQESDILIISLNSTINDSIELIKKSKFIIMISIENCLNKNLNWYSHYNKYEDYGNKLINMYIYNHITKINITPDFLAIPTIYYRMDYFKLKYNYYFNHPELSKSFNEKKFCLVINKSNLNSDIYKLKNKLEKIDTIDHISIYDDKIINKSCYNSIELLKVFNGYKFIICFENSYSDGYITEKIFNCLFAKTIPIYGGSLIIDQYIDNKCFINTKNNIDCNDLFNKINNLNSNEKLYNEYINLNKISKKYNDENYKEIVSKYITNFFN